ncbi:MAG TPA: VWA domain-containing protein, partial [Pyrinomonadaceae bacterium]
MQTKREQLKTIKDKEANKIARSLAAALFVLLLIGVAASSTRAQEDDPPPPPPPPPAAQQKQEQIETLRVDTELVNLNVSVLSRDPQRPVGELQQKDFQVFEDGVPQETAFFASAATPFDLVLLLDLSGSTVEKLNLVRKSARRFVEAARPTDRIGVVTFTNQPRIVSPLTLDRAELIAHIKKIEKPQGGTNFWDALRFVIEHLFDKATDGKDAGGQRRKAIVVMTDGVDNALPNVDGDGSTTTFRELLETVRQSDAIVFPIYLD